MKIESVNVGLPREVLWHGRPVTTGIFKAAVDGRVAVQRLNLDGDGQADLAVGGIMLSAMLPSPSSIASAIAWRSSACMMALRTRRSRIARGFVNSARSWMLKWRT